MLKYRILLETSKLYRCFFASHWRNSVNHVGYSTCFTQKSQYLIEHCEYHPEQSMQRKHPALRNTSAQRARLSAQQLPQHRPAVFQRKLFQCILQTQGLGPMQHMQQLLRIPLVVIQVVRQTPEHLAKQLKHR